MRELRLILAGQRSFGATALEALVKSRFDVAYVITRPDDKLDLAAGRAGVPVRYSMDAADVENADADLILCAHSHDFVGRKSRAATRLGALVGHPSLLPRHRGKSSVEWTIRMGDPIAGFTWFWADDGVDTGPVCAQDWIHVAPGWTYNDLWNKLFPLGIDLMLRTLVALENSRTVIAIPQDERVATREPAIEAGQRLHRPELPALPGRGGVSNGFDVVASREDPRWRARSVN